MPEILRVGFVPGVTPDKWARAWRERMPDVRLELVPVEEADQVAVLRDRTVDMCLLRLPAEGEPDRAGLHLVRLYEELPVVVVPVDHPVAAYDEVPLADLADEQLVVGEVPGWDDLATAERLPFPEMTVREALEVVASGTGIAIVPMALARLHHRKDLLHRVVTGVPSTPVALAWLVERDGPVAQEFVGVVRGRRAGSSRGDDQARPKRRKRKG